jgi:hypothetical protein
MSCLIARLIEAAPGPGLKHKARPAPALRW